MRRFRSGTASPAVGAAVLSLVLAAQARPAAPPAFAREFTPQELARLAGASSAAARHVAAGRFADAEDQVLRGAVLWERAHGRSHWRARAARYEAEQYGRLARLSQEKREAAAKAMALRSRIASLHRRAEYDAAEELSRQALALWRQAVGEAHPETAIACADLASCLYGRGQYAEAVRQFEKSLAIARKALGEGHPGVARCYHNLSSCLQSKGKHADALPMRRTALRILRGSVGEEHPDTVAAYKDLASCLDELGRASEALPLFKKALELARATYGDDHPDTAASYSGVATSLDMLGRHAEALPLHKKALRALLAARGEAHPATAIAYDSVASCLHGQGNPAEALPLFKKALAISREALGDSHPDTALRGNNTAACLQAVGKHAEALPLYRKALAALEGGLGEAHLRTVASRLNVAFCLLRLGKGDEALPLYRKALKQSRVSLGEAHPTTAQAHHTLGRCLAELGKTDGALGHFREALAIRKKVLGEAHPDTAYCYDGVAHCLLMKGEVAEAARNLEAALLGLEFGRLAAADTGFGRAGFMADSGSARAALAVCLVELKQPARAWAHAESDLARGLLDDLSPSGPAPEDVADLAEVNRLNRDLLPLLTREELTDAQRVQARRLEKQRGDLLAALDRRAAKRARDRVLPLADVQKQIPADAALVFWVDAVAGRRMGCVVRDRGDPAWVRLPGSGEGKAWTAQDGSLPARVLAALRDPSGDAAARKRLVDALREQRLGPLEPHLKGVKRLFVIPTGPMARVPVEALTDRYQISYTPSGTILARLRGKERRAVSGSSLLAVADPVFDTAPPPDPPASGVLVRSVLPGSSAAKAGLQPGDVILSVGTQEVESAADLPEAMKGAPTSLVYWREGQRRKGRLAASPLGAVLDERSARAAVRSWRKQAEAVALRGGRLKRLPGTRLEAEAVARLVKGATLLLGSEASEQCLNALAGSGKLSSFRVLHLATHGEASETSPRNTALILAQDKLPALRGQVDDALTDRKPLDGRLTVASVLRDWELDADLVVLSACESGLGREAGGEGMLGFTQALLQKGARAVVLSRWKVDDGATALLMVRFYENLLGKRKGLKQPMGRAAALDEAKRWLRELSRKQAERLAAQHAGGVLRGSEAPLKAPDGTKPVGLKGERPFAHPFYWAAFVLVGEPD